MAEQPKLIEVTPQRRRQTARKRLSERTGSVVARILHDLGLGRQGRDVSRALGGRPEPNPRAVTRLLNNAINDSIGIGTGARKTISAQEAEAALAELDRLGDDVRDRIRRALEARRDG